MIANILSCIVALLIGIAIGWALFRTIEPNDLRYRFNGYLLWNKEHDYMSTFVVQRQYQQQFVYTAENRNSDDMPIVTWVSPQVELMGISVLELLIDGRLKIPVISFPAALVPE